MRSGGGGAYADDYTFTQPDDLSVSGAGWNPTSGIYASAEEYVSRMLITASSDFKLTSEHGDTIPFRITDTSGGASVTSWEFTADELHAAGGTTKTPGIEVSASDIMNARPGNYTINLTFVVSEVEVDLSKLTADFTAKENYTLTGTLGSAGYKITIPDGATVTLWSTDITSIPNNDSHKYAGITCAGNVTLILSGNNKVKGGHSSYPGLFAPTGSTITIKGTGSLTASSNGWAAGIGGGNAISCGNIVIEDGKITAKGGNNAAGIGSGYSSCGDITISGGTVTATGGGYAAGIGSGQKGSCGTITISGGEITATGSYQAAGIGSGYYSSCGTITITSGVTRVTATKGTDAPNSIGAGDGGSCDGVTIGGVEDAITKSPYTYPPSN